MTPTTTPRALLREQCVQHFRCLTATLLRQDEHPWQALDLSMGQLKAMMALGLQGPLPVGSLGRTLGISEPAASLLVDRLEEEGLVHRDQDAADRRRTLVTPTPEALERIERFRHGRTERALEWVDALADDDLAALSRGLTALAEVGCAGAATQARQA